MSQKSLQLGSPNLTLNCSTMSPKNTVKRSKVKVTRQKTVPAWVAAFLRVTTFLKVKVKVKVGFFYYSATYAAMPRPAALYNRRKWQLIVKSKWCGSAMLQLQHRTHTTAPINHTRPSPRKHSPDGVARARKQTPDYSLLLSLSTSKG